jgi:formylglycine-generating enzyme required for sulfatase activity/KaiC/GvpD/RAD55 family RecA-like ATPase
LSAQILAVAVGPNRKIEHLSQGNDNIEALVTYLREIKRQLSTTHLGLMGQRRADLRALYAKAPSTSTLSVEMSGGEPIRWAAHDPDSATADRLNAVLVQGDPDALRWVYDHVGHEIRTSSMFAIDDVRARPLPLSPLSADGIKRRAFPLPVQSYTEFFDRVAVTGPPGSGKSTFAKHLALSFAGGDGRGIDSTSATSERSFLPAYVEFRRFVDFAEWPDSSLEGITGAALRDYLTDQYLRNASADALSTFHGALGDGSLVLILDGFDEIRLPNGKDAVDVRREQAAHFLRLVEEEFEPRKIILTSRDYAYAGWALPGYVEARLGLFERAQIYGLARRMLEFLQPRPEENVDRTTQFFVSLLEASVPPDLRSRPLFVSLLVHIYLVRAAQDLPGLPETSTDLYEESVKLFLDRWTANPADSLLDRLGCTMDQLRERTEAIAYLGTVAAAGSTEGAVRAGDGPGPFDEMLLIRELTQIQGRINYHELVAYLNREVGLITSPQSGQYAFAHRAFQEYLAACHLMRFGPDKAPWQRIPEQIGSASTIWHEVLRLLGVLLVKENRVPDLWSLTDSLIPQRSATAAVTPLAESVSWRVWLGATYIDELLLAKQGLRRTDPTALLEDAVGAIEAVRKRAAPLPLKQMCQLWNTRGRIRARLRPGDDAPQIEWCVIPESTFTMGLGEAGANVIFALRGKGSWLPQRETPEHQVVVPAFSISRFPVTRRDFAAFLVAGDGYADDTNWRRDYLQHRADNFEVVLTDPYGVTYPDFPRTEVTWFDALAYCAWLSRRLSARVSLPTEPQWEKAARGLDGRVFSWGNEYEPAACNAEDAGIESLTAVGAFSAASGYWGDDSPVDMSGNCWEWCTTICETEGGERVFGYPYDAEDGRESEDPSPGFLRIVRGGCYVSPPHQLAATFRGRDKPTLRMNRQGFRVVRSADEKGSLDRS